MVRIIRAWVAIFLLAVPATGGNWPGWRGPDGNGHSPEQHLPLRWSTTENVRWKVPLPDEGNSSPIVWGQRVFLTQARDKRDWPPPGAGGPASAYRRGLLCFDRTDGKLLWQKEIVYKEKESTHPTNPFCSATPVTDGQRVIASFGSAGLVCYDFAGNEQWRHDLGKLEHIWGNASSPILYGDLAILWCGPGVRQFLLAVNKATGQTVWEHQEPGGNVGTDNKNWAGSWTTPVIVKLADHDELILCVPGKVKGLDPKSGKELWSCSGLGPLFYTTPVCTADGIIVALSGFGGAALAVRAGGKGDVTATHRLWQQPQKHPQRIGSPIVVGEKVYVINENGVVQCLDAVTGRDLFDKPRLSGVFWGSFVSGADRLYVTSKAGETFVLSAGPKYELLAKNALEEPVSASIAISNGELFLRTYKHLWCIGEKK
ncbi:MAG TPA: PQQ-binding-like beta-propeller repeat protein [Gemmataceae bacterium]|nr:PQQ-binding-like beta-propeller repeat protein [Gemmataceae bacterium]